MSYILEALKKSEQERSEQGQAPGLQSSHSGQNKQIRYLHKKEYLPWILLGLIASALAGNYLLEKLLNSLAEPVAEIQAAPIKLAVPIDQAISFQQTTVVQQQLSSELNVITTKPANIDINASLSNISHDTAALKAQARNLYASVIDEQTNTTDSQPQLSKAQTLHIASLYEQADRLDDTKESTIIESHQQTSTDQYQSKKDAASKAKPDNNQLAPELATISLTTQETQTTASQSTAEPENIPYATELPRDFQSSIPNIAYSVHIYASENNAGFVILNGKRCYPGDKVEAGLFLETINSDGVVLSFHNTLFRLDAMKDWEG